MITFINKYSSLLLVFLFTFNFWNYSFGQETNSLIESKKDSQSETFSSLRGVTSTLNEQSYFDFIRSSIISQPEYLMAVSGVEEKDMSLKFANRQRFPELSFQIINDTSIDRDINDFVSIRKRRDDSFDANIQLSQPIYTGGKINAEVGIARNEFSMSKLIKEESLSNQIVRANEIYLKAAGSDLLYNYGLKILNEVKPYLDKVRERVNIGIADPIELAIFSIKYNNLESKIQLLRTNRNRDVGVFEYFFRQKFENIFLPEINVPFINSKNSKNAYQVEASILDNKVKKEEIKLTRSEFLPQFGIRTSFTQYDLDDDEIEDTDIRGGMYFSMPIFTFGRASAKISSSRAREKSSKFNIDIERKNDDVVETEIVNVIDSAHKTRFEIYNSYNDTRKQGEIIKARLEFTSFSAQALVDSGLEELSQLERFISTEVSLLHGYMLYLHQNRELNGLIRISP